MISITQISCSYVDGGGLNIEVSIYIIWPTAFFVETKCHVFISLAGVISIIQDIDFETLSSTTWDMIIEVNDGRAVNSGTVTFTIVDIPENITLAITQTSLSINEVMCYIIY